MESDAISQLINGISIITASDAGKDNGMTAAWVTRVSLNPVLIAVAIGYTRYTKGMISNSKAFAVNILAKGQKDLSNHFGMSSGKDSDKMKGISFEKGKTGSPILTDISAYLDCRLVHEYPAGDHVIFVGELLDSKSFGKEPAICQQEY